MNFNFNKLSDVAIVMEELMLQQIALTAALTSVIAATPGAKTQIGLAAAKTSDLLMAQALTNQQIAEVARRLTRLTSS